MAYETMMGMVAVGADGQPTTLTVDENGALRFAGAPAVDPGDPSPGPRPSSMVVLHIARAPNGNPAAIQLDDTGAIMTVGLDGGGEAGEFLPLSGGTMTGLLILSALPTDPLGAASKNYVDTAIGGRLTQAQGDARYLGLAGGSMTGFLLLSGAPTQSTHAVTKQYADNITTTLQATIAALEARVAALEAAASPPAGA